MPPVEDSNALSVEEHVSEVVQLVDIEEPAILRREHALVRDEPEALSEFLHELRALHLQFAFDERFYRRDARHRDRSVCLCRNVSGRIGYRLSLVEMAHCALAVFRVARVGASVLVDRRLEVVACHVRDERIAAADPSAEARPAVRHVEREADAVVEHPADRTEELAVGLRVVMGLSPRVEPRGIVLRAHERTFRLVFADDLESLLGFRSEVRRLEKLGDESVLHDPRRIARVERNLEARVYDGLPERSHVRDVAAVESVLVLDLHHEDRSASRDLKPRELTAHRMQPVRRGNDPARI